MAPSVTGDRRRAAILDAAAQLFAERGYDAVPIDDIAAAVEVSGPSLYWHFPGKPALLDAVLRRGAEHVADTLDAADAASPPPGLTFPDLVRLELDLVLDGRGDVRTLLREGLRTGGLATPAAAGGPQRRSEAVTRAALARSHPNLGPRHAGVRLLAQLGALTTIARAAVPPLPPSRLAALATPAVLALAAAPPAPRTSPPPAPRWQPRLSRRDAIVHAARTAFTTHGYSSTGMDDIAAAAGVSRATAYRYVPGRAEALAAAWEGEAMRFVVGARDALATADSAHDAVDRLAGAYVRVALDCTDLIHVVYGQLGGTPDHQGPWPRLRTALTDSWAAALGDLHPRLGTADVHALTEMTLGAAAHAALAVTGDHAWHDDITGLTAAFAKAPQATPPPATGR